MIDNKKFLLTNNKLKSIKMIKLKKLFLLLIYKLKYLIILGELTLLIK